jgi:hypothetical protein
VSSCGSNYWQEITSQLLLTDSISLQSYISSSLTHCEERGSSLSAMAMLRTFSSSPLCPGQPLIQHVSVISLEVKRSRHEDYHHFHPVPRLSMCGCISSFPRKFSLRDA